MELQEGIGWLAVGAGPPAEGAHPDGSARPRRGTMPRMDEGKPPRPLPDSGGARGLLRVPLLQKLVVADLVINLVAYFVMRGASAQYADEIMLGSLLITLSLNTVLVYWSLRPLQALQMTAARVAAGDLEARVSPSRLADRNIARIGITLNALLDRLLADQARVRYLTAQAIGAADAERAHLARELHDSTAQSLSAVEMLLAATLADAPAGPAGAGLRERLGTMREVVTEALREVRTLSHRVHPSALEHLGLAAALEMLAKRTLEQTAIQSRVEARVHAAISPLVASVLYRVAQEALNNALRHAGARGISVRLEVDEHTARLTVRDDGTGFDVKAAESARTGMGLFMMRERLVLVNGELFIHSDLGRGTTVQADAPNTAEAR
ncbi:sensor histidine kinase [Longimicrobium sp.]|uniref:sensor histidine kinase n=1 Tax=Longimicrobium sp. TaxID=2029185 RepID=UPI002E320962|nr:sensor histidine kinase [Longimicrobium sp.]HEX6037438.1 sensor histidine kinase [Longimicrobium sp.]